LHIPVKPKAIEISHGLWKASGVEANVCHLSQCNPYGKDLEE